MKKWRWDSMGPRHGWRESLGRNSWGLAEQSRQGHGVRQLGKAEPIHAGFLPPAGGKNPHNPAGPLGLQSRC